MALDAKADEPFLLVRSDEEAFPAEALHESRRITGYLAGGGVPGAEADPSRQTPRVNGAARLREDLWTRLGALREHRGWACAQQLAACAEVELVHAGNEHNQLGWRHARPYIQIAEDQVGDAARAAELCPVDPPPAPPTTRLRAAARHRFGRNAQAPPRPA